MRPTRILLVDDETEVLRLLSRRLTRQGHEVSAAANSSQALALLKQAPFAIAILDVMMPGMNGLELAAQCHARHPGVKILMLTGSLSVAEIEAARYAYLRKPLENLQELDAAIERLLAQEVNKPTEDGGQ